MLVLWLLLVMKVLSKKRYRKFDIKTKGAEQDDFAMLKEVLSRRFKRAILEKGNYLTLPDLILN